ncbi:hypothetical protein BCR44DRAFT_44043 [Catenaria anguillulae PL171]|uniref:Uncharacterized protein n=1 Tax=Catenaria anguillulae PL171 TaxID=765915 RepID=A0A1Y2HUC0_9FUNG|nr:hypothetical protein BCR44DRAFT_44043 [Catenaria anguillulae PL171]
MAACGPMRLIFAAAPKPETYSVRVSDPRRCDPVTLNSYTAGTGAKDSIPDAVTSVANAEAMRSVT